MAQQFRMGPLLDDPAPVDHDQPVEGRDGREPVGDGHHGLALHERRKRLLDRRLDLRIEGGGRLVEHQDGRVLQDHPGDGDALALAARELDAALAHMGVVAPPPPIVLEFEDEIVGMGEPGRLHDVALLRVRAPVGDIVADGAVQQGGVLRHHGDGGAQAVLA